MKPFKYITGLLATILIACTSGIICVSCITEPDTTYNQVITIEPTIVSYYDEAGDNWICKEATIDSKPPRKVMYPKQYEDEIFPGTQVNWHCHKILSYKKNGKLNYIDWEGSIRN